MSSIKSHLMATIFESLFCWMMLYVDYSLFENDSIQLFGGEFCRNPESEEGSCLKFPQVFLMSIRLILSVRR